MILSLTLPIRRNSFSKKKKKKKTTHVNPCDNPKPRPITKTSPPSFRLIQPCLRKTFAPLLLFLSIGSLADGHNPVFYIIKPRKGRERQREESSSASLTPRVLVSSWAKKPREIERERERKGERSPLCRYSHWYQLQGTILALISSN